MTRTENLLHAGLAILSGMALVASLSGCTASQVKTAETDFTTACHDWNAAAGVVDPVASLNPVAAVIVSYVGDACSAASFIDGAGPEQVAWIQQSTANLKAVTK